MMLDGAGVIIESGVSVDVNLGKKAELFAPLRRAG